MKHRLNGHHTNDGVNISSKRCVTSAAASHWRRDLDAEAFSSDRAHVGDYAFACSWSSSPSSSPPPRHRRPHHRQSPHRRFFVSGLFVYLFPRIEGRPIGRGRPTFRAFGKQLAALFAKILAFQAIILAF
jgi:hypothetical protein